ncbi:MAG: PIN domain-containing protein [Thermoleophilia bacterium]|nr:PIN domain-containing protein [Thermoleophilia bacterium]
MSDPVFVDTSFWVALQQRRDTNHERALDLAGAFRSARLVTSNLVVGETWTLLRRRDGHGHAIDWLNRVRSAPSMKLERIAPELEDEAWAWLGVHDERVYSFVDATSFALMRRLRLREVLAFDGDFAAAGFVELRA